MVLALVRLADEMKRQELRPEDLAAKTGLSVRTILNARSGKVVSFGTASLISQKLKVKVADLTADPTNKGVKA